MNIRRIAVLSALLSAAGASNLPGVEARLLTANKIWDQAPHNAFTDLVRWHDQFYCAFREGSGHVSSDGTIRVLHSEDGRRWNSIASVAKKGYDLRDADLTIMPDGSLMLLGGAAPRKQDGQSAPTGTFVSFSSNGTIWTEPQIVIEPGRWLWRVAAHKGKLYGFSYDAGSPARSRHLDLLVSADAIHFATNAPNVLAEGYPSEVSLEFDADDTGLALVRRDGQPQTALLGKSRPPYTAWTWQDLGPEFNGFGGPNFIQTSFGWIGAGRMHQGGAHTALTSIDPKTGTMKTLLKLPSGGDTSYPGMVWHDGILWVSYYASHEGKTSIYLAQVKLK